MVERKQKIKTKNDEKLAETCCQMDAVVTVDARGQVVLPKEIRKRLGIKAGDKMAVVSYSKDASMCCIVLVKVGGLAKMVKIVLAPMAKEVLGE